MSIVHKTVQRVGNSSGVVLPPEILKEAGLERGDKIIVRAERGQIIISPRVPLREEVLTAAETVIARYDDVFRRLAQ
jgi:putative addiction module antidote